MKRCVGLGVIADSPHQILPAPFWFTRKMISLSPVGAQILRFPFVSRGRDTPQDDANALRDGIIPPNWRELLWEGYNRRALWIGDTKLL